MPAKTTALLFILLFAIFVLGCLFPNYLVEAIRAKDEEYAKERRQRAGVAFGAMMFLLCLFIANV